MQARGNMLVANLDDPVNETIALSYFVKDVGSEETAKEIKKLFDKIVTDQGGEVTSSSKE